MSIRPPRVRMITFHSCHRLIYCRRFVQYRTLLCLASSSVSIQPHMRFLSVSASVCVRLPSDSTSRWTPLSFANSSYCQVCSGLSPPSYHPCRAHQQKRSYPGSGIAPFFSYWIRLTESRMINSGSNILLPVTSCCTASMIHSAAASPNSSFGWERVVSLTLPAVLKNESSLPTTE